MHKTTTAAGADPRREQSPHAALLKTSKPGKENPIMANRIPRNAALFHITLLQDTGSNKAGTKATVYRHVYDGWQMLTESGERFMVLTSYLRMSEVVQIDDFMLFPEEITEAQFQDVKKITAKHYNRLYNADDIETDNESMIYSSLFDWYLSKHAEAVRKYNAHCFDFLTSDREGAAFMLALYELQNAYTEKEITEGKEDTTTAETEPQNATETAQKTEDRTTDMETFKKAYSAAYSHLYDHANTPAVKAKSRIYSALFDEQWEQIKDIAKAFCKIAGDLITSDRECAAFMIALETVGAPTDGETATDGETTTTPETDAQRATETPRKTIRTGERLYSHPHRHMVTVEGLQGELVRVIYRGRLYLVCCGDLYTDETETTPAILPAEPEANTATAEATQPAAVIPMENDTTKTTQEGTESATATTGRECTQQATQNAQNAHRRPETVRAIQGHTERHKRPYRAAQRAGKSIMRHSPTTATAGRPHQKTHFSAGMEAGVLIDLVKRPPPNLAQKF